MTAEQFHDAISGLPTELIAQVDWRRAHPKKKRIPWGRSAALAASLGAVVLCGWLITGIFHAGSKSADTTMHMESAAAQSREDMVMEAAPKEKVTATYTDGEILYPGITLLDIVEESLPRDSAENYQAPSRIQVITRREDLPVGADLSEDWFEDHDLVAFFLTGYPEAPTILQIQNTENRWEFRLPASNGEGRCWYLLLAAEKGLISPDQITLVFSDQ